MKAHCLKGWKPKTSTILAQTPWHEHSSLNAGNFPKSKTWLLLAEHYFTIKWKKHTHTILMMPHEKLLQGVTWPSRTERDQGWLQRKGVIKRNQLPPSTGASTGLESLPQMEGALPFLENKICIQFSEQALIQWLIWLNLQEAIQKCNLYLRKSCKALHTALTEEHFLTIFF